MPRFGHRAILLTACSSLRSNSFVLPKKVQLFATAFQSLHVQAATSQRPAASRMGATTTTTSTCSSATDASNMSCINADSTRNPLVREWTSQPFLLPPFSSISPSHFPPAFQEGMKQHLSDLQAIIDNPAEPTFDNTIAAYDRAGALLSRVSSVFSNFCSSLNTDELKEVQKEIVPILSRHSSTTYTLPGLFERISAVFDKRHDIEGLTPEQIRLIERLRLDFTRQGAHFNEEQKKEYADLKANLARLCTEFGKTFLFCHRISLSLTLSLTITP